MASILSEKTTSRSSAQVSSGASMTVGAATHLLEKPREASTEPLSTVVPISAIKKLNAELTSLEPAHQEEFARRTLGRSDIKTEYEQLVETRKARVAVRTSVRLSRSTARIQRRRAKTPSPNSQISSNLETDLQAAFNEKERQVERERAAARRREGKERARQRELERRAKEARLQARQDQ